MSLTAEQTEALEHAQWADVHSVALQIGGWPEITTIFDRCGLFTPAAQWARWRAFLGAAWGLPLSAPELEAYGLCTGRTEPPTERATEVDAIVGRRGGKSRIIALAALHLATERDLSKYLSPGETATIPVISQDRSEAGTVMGYIRALCELPAYKALLDREPTSERIRLRVCGVQVEIQVQVASFRAVRSYTVVGAVLDEVAFWRSDEAGSMNPDTEVLRALRPAMATVPGSMLFKVSSPYGRSGVLWRDYREHYGQPGPHLVWKAPTLAMHPDDGSLASTVAQAYRDDPVAAAAEYGADFRSDLVGLIAEETLDQITEPRGGLPPEPGVVYRGFVDVSGGSSDSFALGISHWVPAASMPGEAGQRPGMVVVDLVREWLAPFDPDVVTREACDVLRLYRVQSVTGDRYGGEWPATRFRANRIGYMVSEDDKSALYLHFAAMGNGRRVSLPEHPRLRAQLLSLDRRVWASGRETVDHPRGGHDDLANVAAGAAVFAERHMAPYPAADEGPLTREQEAEKLMAQRRAALWERMNKWKQEKEPKVNARLRMMR